LVANSYGAKSGISTVNGVQDYLTSSASLLQKQIAVNESCGHKKAPAVRGFFRALSASHYQVI
ncbi:MULTISPECIES: hypothetical protein, partial [unclassified Pseudomonas]|uniref:hypothetical protein n=1 Tax=unclassified Pseudomonas TaxID=196821 RepID=UPI001C458512